MNLLSFLLIPAVGAVLCVALPARLTRVVALTNSLIGVFFALQLMSLFDNSLAGQLQFTLSFPWIQALKSQFAIGVDGVSFPLICLTKVMVPIAIIASWNETRHIKAHMSLYLLLDVAMTGTFLATDLFLFYVFWELMLIPMFLLIGVWGSSERIFASLKFFLYTFAGSIFMLIGILYLATQGKSNDAFQITSMQIASFYGNSFPNITVFWGLKIEDFVFWSFALAFLIKVPLFPFHTWLPDAHVQAPTGGSILLAAILLKMGLYGLIRFAIPICPASFAKFHNFLALLALIGGIYGAWVSFQQSDLKKLVAYSSVSHLAFAVLGICSGNPQGIAGALMQSINHGLSTGALFFLVGALYERRHSRDFSQFGGLASVMPKFSVFLVLASCASMGVPGLNGFVGEFLILFGAYRQWPIWGLIPVTVVVFGALYTLRMIAGVIFGEITIQENRSLKDLMPREVAVLSFLTLAMVLLGVYPNCLLRTFNSLIASWSLLTTGAA